MFVLRSNYLEYLSRFSGMAALQNSHALPNCEVLFEFFCVDFDLDWHLVKSFNCGNLLLADGFDSASAAVELATDDFAPVSDLDLELDIVPDGLEDGLVFQHVPLVLVRIVSAPILFKQVRVQLEAPYFVEHGADILMDELVDVELVEQIAIPEHHVFPQIHIFAYCLG